MPRPLILILCLLPAVVIGLLYWRYRQTPAARWASKVRSRVAELKERLDALLNPSNRQQSPAEKLAEELFLKQRQNVPANDLARYANIGPGTIEQLRKAGITNLVDAEEHVFAFLFKKKIDNLGEFREAALKSAVNELRTAERQRFDTGATPEGAEYLRRLANLSADEQAKAAAKARERTALETCIDRMRGLEQAADTVNFTGWVLRQPVTIDAELMAKPFPTVEVAEAPPPPVIVPAPTSTHASTTPPASQPHPQLPKLQAYCRFAFLVAKADGRIAAAERSTIRSFLSSKFGSDAVLQRHIDPQMELAEANLTREDDALKEIQRVIPPSEWSGLSEFAISVADATGGRNAKETQYLADLAAALGIAAPAVIEESPAVVPTSPPVAIIDHRAALDIDATTPITADLVRRKYALLLDRTAKAKALGGDFATMALAQEAAGTAAAETLLAPLGEPLIKPIAEPPTDIRHNPELDDLFK